MKGCYEKIDFIWFRLDMRICVSHNKTDLAGAVGIEPTLAVLETAVLPLNDPPLPVIILFPGSSCLLVHSVFPAPVAELLIFNFPLNKLFVF